MTHSDLHERVAVVESETDSLQEFRRDMVRRLQRVEWMLAVSIGTGILGVMKGCL